MEVDHADSPVMQLRQASSSVRKLLSRVRGKQVQAASVKNAAKTLVTTYCNRSRPGEQ